MFAGRGLDLLTCGPSRQVVGVWANGKYGKIRTLADNHVARVLRRVVNLAMAS